MAFTHKLTHSTLKGEWVLYHVFGIYVGAIRLGWVTSGNRVTGKVSENVHCGFL